MGSLRRIRVPLGTIHRVRSSWESGAHDGRGALNLVPFAYPNRMLDLDPPLVGRRGPIDRIALRVDDPAGFDAALAARAIPSLTNRTKVKASDRRADRTPDRQLAPVERRSA